jgi:hypothetical protein
MRIKALGSIVSAAILNKALICGVSVIDLAERLKIPPPSEMSSGL